LDIEICRFRFRIFRKMTTAHRPTFHPAQGGTGKNESDLSKLSKQYSSRDMPSHTKVKYRQSGQGSTDDVKSKDFRKELEEREKAVSKDKRGRDSSSSGAVTSGSTSTSSSAKKPRLDQVAAGGNLDADDPVDDDDEQDDDDDEDDTAELMAELARIKKEREAEKARMDAEKKAEDEKIRTESILHGNPLLAGSKQDFKVKRRWDDDVVFKNCAKGLDDKKKEATFINDSLRSEFHKKFMDKYIK